MNFTQKLAGIFATVAATISLASPVLAVPSLIYTEESDTATIEGCVIDYAAFEDGLSITLDIVGADLEEVESGSTISLSGTIGYDFGLPTCYEDLLLPGSYVEIEAPGSYLTYTLTSPALVIDPGNVGTYDLTIDAVVPADHDVAFSDELTVTFYLGSLVEPSTALDLDTGSVSP